MSVTDLPDTSVIVCNVPYLTKLLSWRNQQAQLVGRIIKVPQFTNHNFLVEVNQIFSTMPAGMIVDRTQHAKLPVTFQIPRPWAAPTKKYTLEQALEFRVQKCLNTDQKINLFWSGGIDSTTMLTAFLKYTQSRSQLRILYTPFSTYEHPLYLDFLKQFSNLELVDLSGTTYTNTCFDGIFLTGDGGDEFMASLDESFFSANGREILDTSWQDFFYKKNNNDQFIEFCHGYFSLAQRPIDTVLEARWFFYAMCKTRFQLWSKLDLFSHYKNFLPSRLQGFYDCEEFENYIYWNLDQIIPGKKYSNWKLPLKKYCVEFDNFKDFYENKQKVYSVQTQLYANKNQILQDQRMIFRLVNGHLISTPNLPFFSRREFENKYKNTLDYLFNDPD
jgi:hypothetical protein